MLLGAHHHYRRFVQRFLFSAPRSSISLSYTHTHSPASTCIESNLSFSSAAAGKQKARQSRERRKSCEMCVCAHFRRRPELPHYLVFSPNNPPRTTTFFTSLFFPPQSCERTIYRFMVRILWLDKPYSHRIFLFFVIGRYENLFPWH